MLSLPPLYEAESISVVQQDEEPHCSWQTTEMSLLDNVPDHLLPDLGKESALIDELPVHQPTPPVEHSRVPQEGVKRQGYRINQSNRKVQKLPKDLVELKRTVLNLQKDLLEEEKIQKAEINRLTIENLKLDIKLKKGRLKIMQQSGDREFEDELKLLLGRK